MLSLFSDFHFSSSISLIIALFLLLLYHRTQIHDLTCLHLAFPFQAPPFHSMCFQFSIVFPSFSCLLFSFPILSSFSFALLFSPPPFLFPFLLPLSFPLLFRLILPTSPRRLLGVRSAHPDQPLRP